MHDPSCQVFEIQVPIPVVAYKVRATANGLHRRRWTGGGPAYLGKPMHHPFHPHAWELVIAGRLIRWWDVIEVWHEEPEGRDSGSVCKGQKGSQLTWHNVKWAWVHRSHCRVYSPPVRRVRRWRTARCAGCGLPFRWKRDSRHALGWGASDVYHGPCASLVTVHGQLEDAYKVLAFEADETTAWRVGRALDHRGKADTERSPAP